MARRIVTLTTDFGLSDHFTGVMKGVILSIAPAAEIVDITHQAEAFDISGGAFAIGAAYRYFPKKTVHVVVIDPGVGTSRRALVAEAAGQFFVAPDNGVLSMIYAREKHKVRAIVKDEYFRKPVSRTFHGRDIFAPVAAHLARGVPAARFGKLIDNYLKLPLGRPVRTGKRFWQGTVLKVDHFGNLITNFHIDEFPALATRPFQLTCGQAALTELVETFAQGAPGEPVLVVGSSGYVEIAANRASAAKALACGAGSPVDLILW
ncbi:MAG: S-adenosyl-l-methionine hydroxide adenosyltransferase family protein [Acidobacteriota bacterium]